MRRTITVVCLLAAGLLLTACDDRGGGVDGGAIRQDNIEDRWGLFERAESLYPMPQTQNFPLRQALIQYTERQDQMNHPWYIYVLGDNGNIIGYYVGKTAPQSTCNFLSSTEDIVDIDDEPDQVLTAPSLDGIYYGGSGATSSCAMSFFFDYESDALVMVPSIRLFVTDAPLAVEADPIQVQPSP